jgi:membrane-bound lytic murein transglycosylase B
MRTKFGQYFFIIIFLFGLSSQAHALTKQEIDGSEAMKNFIRTMVKNSNYSEEDVIYYLKHSEISSDILKKISKPYETKPWNEYRKFFLTQDRIEKGVALWEDYPTLFEDIHEHYGVPTPIVISIMGVETFYGKILGHYRVLDALTTLAFYYPPRGAFFTDELKNYLLLCQQLEIDPTKIRGSYAGAIGLPQFMPSSYRRYAIDYNGNGEINLIESHPDALASIANYLKEKGWHAHEPIALPVYFKDADSEKILALLKENQAYSPAKWHEKGLLWKQKQVKDLPARLIALTSNDEKEYWLVFNNFDVILRYNKSPQYAMAVYLLSKKIATMHAANQQNATLI